MHPSDPMLPLFFLASAIIAFALGYLASYLQHHWRIRRIERDTWRTATHFYQTRARQEKS